MNWFTDLFKRKPAQGGEFGGGGASGTWDGTPLTHPNTIAFLTMLSACEGTRGPNGYRALFGFNEKLQAPCFESFDDHPRRRFRFVQTDGKVNYTTAAGRYQFLARIWDEVALQIGATDFTPASQDRGAIRRIEYRGALDDVVAGRLELAIEKCGREWASLPSARYPQHRRSIAFARSAYLAAGGSLAP